MPIADHDDFTNHRKPALPTAEGICQIHKDIDIKLQRDNTWITPAKSYFYKLHLRGNAVFITKLT